jgi:hypothetical protein
VCCFSISKPNIFAFARARICKRFSPGIDSKESIPPAYLAWWADNPAWAGGIDFFESIPGLLKRLQIRALLPAILSVPSI